MKIQQHLKENFMENESIKCLKGIFVEADEYKVKKSCSLSTLKWTFTDTQLLEIWLYNLIIKEICIRWKLPKSVLFFFFWDTIPLIFYYSHKILALVESSKFIVSNLRCSIISNYNSTRNGQ